MPRQAVGVIGGVLIALVACTSADAPDESGLTQADKRLLVERYYACARKADARCARATLHPDFQAIDHPSGPASGAAHVEALIEQLRRARVEARIMPRESNDLWVVEMWIDRHGSAASRLRAFTFEDRLIRQKSAIA